MENINTDNQKSILSLKKFKEQVTLLRGSLELHDKVLSKEHSKTMVLAILIGLGLNKVFQPEHMSVLANPGCYGGVFITFYTQVRDCLSSFSMHKKANKIETELNILGKQLDHNFDKNSLSSIEEIFGKIKVLPDFQKTPNKVKQFNNWLKENGILSIRDLKKIKPLVDVMQNSFAQLAQEITNKNLNNKKPL